MKTPKNIFRFETLAAAAKVITVICAFLAFELSMRQKEFDRFSQIKPFFEIESSGVKDFRGK